MGGLKVLNYISFSPHLLILLFSKMNFFPICFLFVVPLKAPILTSQWPAQREILILTVQVKVLDLSIVDWLATQTHFESKCGPGKKVDMEHSSLIMYSHRSNYQTMWFVNLSDLTWIIFICLPSSSSTTVRRNSLFYLFSQFPLICCHWYCFNSNYL